MKFTLSTFSFIVWCHTEKSLPNPRSWRFFSYLGLWSIFSSFLHKVRGTNQMCNCFCRVGVQLFQRDTFVNSRDGAVQPGAGVLPTWISQGVYQRNRPAAWVLNKQRRGKYTYVALAFPSSVSVFSWTHYSVFTASGRRWETWMQNAQL